jgi:hypothetical protein
MNLKIRQQGAFLKDVASSMLLRVRRVVAREPKWRTSGEFGRTQGNLDPQAPASHQ